MSSNTCPSAESNSNSPDISLENSQMPLYVEDRFITVIIFFSVFVCFFARITRALDAATNYVGCPKFGFCTHGHLAGVWALLFELSVYSYICTE